jgi:hypothetical protein
MKKEQEGDSFLALLNRIHLNTQPLVIAKSACPK